MDKIIELLKEKRGVEFRFDDKYTGSYDWCVESISTADGYELWCVREKYSDIDVYENGYYYESGAIEKVTELIKEDENITIHFYDTSIYEDIDWYEIEEDLEDELYEYSDNNDLNDAWEDEILPNVQDEYEQDGQIDSVARKESFNNWTDGLFSKNKISQSLYDNAELNDSFLDED